MALNVTQGMLLASHHNCFARRDATQVHIKLAIKKPSRHLLVQSEQ